MGLTDSKYSKRKPSTSKEANENDADIGKCQPQQIYTPARPNLPNNQSLRTHTSRVETEDIRDNDVPTTLEFKPINLKRQKHNPFMTDMRIYSSRIYTDNENKSNLDDNKQDDDIDIEPLIGCFEFGELFSYWDPKSVVKKFIVPAHKSLKDEVTNNKNEIYMHEETWNEFLEKARVLSCRMYDTKGSNIPIYAKCKPYWNQLFKIKPGSKMSIDHILAIILYTDTSELQKYFKEQTRKIHCTETVQDVANKNRKYANWFRLLFEVVWLFGKDLKYNQKVYHGINCRLLFNKFQYDFNAPLSTTYDENVAANFCSDAGIILELRNSESTPQPYFNVANFSRFGYESEYLFFGATLKITSIMLPDPNSSKYLNYSKHIDVLNFYMQILNGNEIERYSSTHSANKEKHLRNVRGLCKRTLKLILQHMKLLRGEDLGDFDGGYMWKLFVNFTKRNSIIWVNKKKLKYLKALKCESKKHIELVNKFIVFGEDGNDELGEYLKLLLQTNSNLKVSFAQEWEWIVKQDELNKLQNDGNIVCKDYWDYFIDNGINNIDKRCVTFGGNMVSGFHDHNFKQENEVKKVGFYWRLSDIPAQYKSVVVSVELYCPQIEFYIQFFNVKMDKNGGLVNTGHTSLFPISQLDEFDTFTWRIIMKCRAIEKGADVESDKTH